MSPGAEAASLQQVNGWSTGGVPADVTMHVYVPDKVATKPPVLALIHYCGGTAPAVFGQAQGGGVVKAADDYGFIMVVPSSGRCWDIVSDKTRKRDGGGDSHAIMQMVKHALTTYQANPDRVYATGDSSGGMMTELLLALYPDVFKAGSAFAGMPAGCRGANESGNGGGYSNACAGGTVTHTPEQWGEIARNLFPGYTGPRPRVQLFHGDADDIIRYPNHTEAVKEWTNVLGVGPSPTSTDSVPLGNHQAKRERWQNECGQVVVDAFTSLGGDHGPSDALFEAEYVIPFLGLDKTGPLDPLPPCGAGGGGGAGGGANGGNGGVGGAGGGGGSGGTSTAGTAGSSSGGTTGGSTGQTGGGTPSTSGAGPAGTSGSTSAAGGGGASGAGAAASSPGSGSDSSGCALAIGASPGAAGAGGWFTALLLFAWGARARKRGGNARG